MHSRWRLKHVESSLGWQQRLWCGIEGSMSRQWRSYFSRSLASPPSCPSARTRHQRLRHPQHHASIASATSPATIHFASGRWVLGNHRVRIPAADHYYQQVRFFDYRKAAKKKNKSLGQDNPFKILRLHEGVTLYKDAKKKFLKIAMSNHPDVLSSRQAGGDDEDSSSSAKGDDDGMTLEERKEIFIRARVAFERLAEDPNDGLAILKEDLDDAMENFDSWFQSETGLATPFQFDLDPQTMKEVAAMTEEIGGGLDRDGGMWALARMVTASVKAGSDAATVLRLEAGDVKDANKSLGGSLRRVRKR